LQDVLISDEPKQPKEQTPEQMLEKARLINAALGGDEVEI